MTIYHTQQVGTRRPVAIEANNPLHAVMIAAACNIEDVGEPIWRRGPRFDGTYQVECFQPQDNTGRQWTVAAPTPAPRELCSQCGVRKAGSCHRTVCPWR